MSKYHEKFAKYLLDEMESELSWSKKDVVVGKLPEEEVFLGAFIEKDAQSEKIEIYPNHIGLQYQISKNLVKEGSLIENKFSCDFFYRIAPSYEEQINYLINTYKDESGKSETITIDGILLKHFINDLNTNLEKYSEEVSDFERTTIIEQIKEKANFSNFEVSFLPVNVQEQVLKVYNSFLNKELSTIKLTYKDREMELKYKKFKLEDYPSLIIKYDEKLNPIYDIEKFNEDFNNVLTDEKSLIDDMLKVAQRLRVKDILNESNFDEYLNHISDDTLDMTPNWQLEIKVNHIKFADKDFFEVLFSNENQQNTSDYRSIKYPYSTKVYNSKITVSIDRNSMVDLKRVAFDKFQITDLVDSYRYDVKKYGNALNCGVKYYYENNQDNLTTTNFTLYEEKRRITREYENTSLKFADFAQKPVKTLENIYKALKEEHESLSEYINKYKNDKETYQKALEDYEMLNMELRRFKFGIECIKNFDLVHDAFVYLNESFDLEKEKYDSWRLFQVVFIVSNIPDMIVSHYGEDELKAIKNNKITDMVDILYFPTGGGKTEAFLGSVLFSLFFDRLRGKNEGLTAIIKYPLRLLSIQQVERVMQKLASAQKIKNKYNIKGAPFSLGYFVGSVNTPNSIDDYNSEKEKLKNNPTQYLQISKCPACNFEVKLKVNVREKEYNHYCTNEECQYNNKIPYLFVDEEIYKSPPSVLISTLDKFSIMAFKDNFKNLFLVNKKDAFDPLPTLSIIDEIHLIKESLGTFASHYESFFYYYCSNLVNDFGFKGKKLKYMGATATISNYKHQAKELFMKDATLFPALSLKDYEDFYSKIDHDDITRLNVVIMPFGTSSIGYILKIMGIQRMLVSHYIENPSLISHVFDDKLNEDEIKEILYNYYIMIQYSNTKRDSSRVRNGVDSFLNNVATLKEKYFLTTNTLLTGDTRFEEVKTLLSDISRSVNPVDDNIPNYITATSMISHGVDNNRFNSMYFLGIPFLFAEYIQASSRVGRRYTGIVYNIIRPIRIREESFLSNFNEFLEYKELMISPIPISRYSIGGLKKTFNGVLISLLRQYLLPRSQTTTELENFSHFVKILTEFREKPIRNYLRQIYSHKEQEGKEFDKAIISLVKETFDFIRNQSNVQKYKNYSIKRVIRYVNSTNEAPLTSLRDTDSGVLIKLEEAYNV